MLALGSGLIGETPPTTTRAIIHAGPETSVDGTVVLDSMVVNPGEEVLTASDKPADIALPGTTLRVLGNSRIKYHQEFIELSAGGASVTTTSRFKTASGCFSAEPVGTDNTRYSTLFSEGRVVISAELGAVLLKTRKQLLVPAGKSATVTSCGEPAEKTVLDGSSSKNKWIAAALGGGGAAIAPLAFGGGGKTKEDNCEPPVSSGSPNNCD